MGIRVRFFLSVVVAGFSWLASPSGWAQETKPAEPLKVAFATGEYRPYTSESIPGFGAATELVSAICKAANIVPAYVFVPWKRAEVSLVEGSVFGAFPYAPTPERRLQFDFSNDLYKVFNALVYYEGNPKVKGLSGKEELLDLKAYKFGIIAGSFAEPRLKQLGIAYQEVSTVEQLVGMLKLGRFDIYIDAEPTIYDAVNRLFPADASRFRSLERPFEDLNPNAVMVSRTYPNAAAIQKRFNAGLEKIKKSGEYDRILEKHRLRQK